MVRQQTGPFGHVAVVLLLGARFEGWMLDFAAMIRWIGFNHKNQWFFRATEHPFMFAFDDVVFDRHGFPHPPPG